MVKKSKRKVKHIPQRTCVGCREVLTKKALTRIVNGPEGVKVDLTGKAHGRGAYLHNDRSCWQRGIDGALEHALKTKLRAEEVEDLLAYMNKNIPDDDGTINGTEENSG